MNPIVFGTLGTLGTLLALGPLPPTPAPGAGCFGPRVVDGEAGTFGLARH